HQRPDCRCRSLADCGEGQLQERGEGLSHRIFLLYRLHYRWRAGPSKLEGSSGKRLETSHQHCGVSHPRLCLHGHRNHRRTIAPWMQFYLQASVVEKGVTERDYKTTRIDIFVGSVFAVIVAAFIIIACAATLNRFGHPIISDAADAAQALGPL